MSTCEFNKIMMQLIMRSVRCDRHASSRLRDDKYMVSTSLWELHTTHFATCCSLPKLQALGAEFVVAFT